MVRRLRRGRCGRRAAAGPRTRGEDRAGGRADAARERDRGGGDGARPARVAPRHEGERGRGSLGGLRPRRRDGGGGKGRAGARLLPRVVRSRYPHLHRDGRPAGAGARADALRDLGVRRRLLVRPHEERQPRRAGTRLRGARAPADGGLLRRRRMVRARKELRRAGHARPPRPRRRRVSGAAEPPDLPRRGPPSRPGRGPPRPRAALRAPGRRRHDRGGNGPCDRARRLLGRWRRIAGGGQLPDHGARRRKAFALPRRGRRRMSGGEFWTGGLNEGFAFDAQVGFYDTTLRDGEQTVGVVLSPEEKLELAHGLDELGIERIEAGFPLVSADDWRAVELISKAGLRAEVWGFSRAVRADVEALVELEVRASVIESPISDLKLAAL